VHGHHARSTNGDRMVNIIVDGCRLYPNGMYFFPSGKLSGSEATTISRKPPASQPCPVILWREDPQNPRSPAVVNVMGAIGAPNPEWFIDSAGQPRYTPLDFIWGFLHVQRETTRTVLARGRGGKTRSHPQLTLRTDKDFPD
jgi:hypothetical protein